MQRNREWIFIAVLAIFSGLLVSSYAKQEVRLGHLYEASIISSAISRNGDFVALSYDDGRFDIMNAQSFEILFRSKEGTARVSSIHSWSSNDLDYFVTVRSDGTVNIFNPKDMNLKKATHEIPASIFAPLIEMEEETGRIWLLGETDEGIWQGHFSDWSGKDERGVFSFDDTKDLKKMGEGADQNVTPGDITLLSFAILEGHKAAVNSVVFSPQGDVIASGSDDNTIRLWDVKSGEAVSILRGLESAVVSVAFSPQGDVLASGNRDNKIRLWDVKSGKMLSVLRGHEDWIQSVVFSSQGDVLASGGDDNTIRLWDVKSGKALNVLRGHDNAVNSVAFSPRGDVLVSGGNDNTIRLWNVRSGKAISVLRGHNNSVHAVAFSPQGGVLASGDDDNTIRLWDVKSGEALNVLRAHDNAVNSVAFSPQGDVLVSSSRDETIRLWDVKSGEAISVSRGLEKSVMSVAFSPQGGVLASGNWGGTIRLWDLTNCGREIESPNFGNAEWAISSVNGACRLGTDKPSRILFPSPISTSAFLSIQQGQADSKSLSLSHLITGHNDGMVQITNLETETSLARYYGHSKDVTQVQISKDASTLLTTSEDGSFQIIALPPKQYYSLAKVNMYLPKLRNIRDMALRVQPYRRNSKDNNQSKQLERPNILDRNGELLATTLERYTLYANTNLIWNQATIVDLLKNRFPDLDEKSLVQRLSNGSEEILVLPNLSLAEKNDIFDFGVTGLFFRKDSLRHYPNNNLASHVLGFVDTDMNGIAGLERTLDQSVDFTDPSVFSSSIDIRIQEVLEEELNESIQRFKALNGIGIVQDIITGEILAMSSIPSFNPNNAASSSPKDRYNNATLSVYDPGFLVAPLTAAMSLEEGLINQDEGFPVNKPVRVGDKVIKDPHPSPTPLSVSDILAEASNRGAALIGLRAGAVKQKQFLNNIGLFNRVPIEIAESAAPQLQTEWEDITTATVSYGYGIAVTPLHMTSAIGAILNGGQYVTPTLLRVDNANKPTGRAVISAETSRTMADIMRYTVTNGVARNADVEGFGVMATTSTVEKLVEGNFDPDKKRTFTIASFPVWEPRYVVMIMLDEPQAIEGTYGYATSGWNAAPTTRRVVTRIVELLDIPKEPLATLE